MKPVLGCFVALLVLTLGVSNNCLGTEPKAGLIDAGNVQFVPVGNQDKIPEAYQLKKTAFAFQLKEGEMYEISGYRVDHLTFPSPVVSPHVENNTVHAAYYRPLNRKKFPCVIVLHITGGDQSLTRMISSHLAQNGIGALMVQMAYYGPRRPPGSKLRLLSYDLKHTQEAIRQTVLDLRCATAWMESRKEIEKEKIGIMGTSLGGFMAALTAEMEPKLGRVAILLAGGGLVDAYYEHPKAEPYRKLWEAMGGTKESVKKIFAPMDPLTCAENLKNRRVLMMSAKRDEIVPAAMAEALWKASGQQTILWYDTTHYGAALYLIPALRHVVDHFTKD